MIPDRPVTPDIALDIAENHKYIHIFNCVKKLLIMCKNYVLLREELIRSPKLDSSISELDSLPSLSNSASPKRIYLV